MLSLPSCVSIFVARDPVDGRKGFDGLAGLVREGFGEDPYSGNLFIFFNKRRDRVKILVWDSNGYWVFSKRLEGGTFPCVEGGEAPRKHLLITRAQFHMILEGIDLKTTRFRRYFDKDLTPRRSRDTYPPFHESDRPGSDARTRNPQKREYLAEEPNRVAQTSDSSP